MNGTSQNYRYLQPVTVQQISGQWFADIHVEGKAKVDSSTSRTVHSQAMLTSVFNYAIMVKDRLEFKNKAVVDGYDSDAGSYGGTNSGYPVVVGTNDDDPGDITLKVGVDFDDSSLVVVGYTAADDPASVVDNKSDFTGEIVAATEEIPFPPVILPAVGNTNDKLVVADNETVTLSGESYLYKSVDVAKNGTLILEGDNVLNVLSGGITVDGGGAIIVNGETTIRVYNGDVNFKTNSTMTLENTSGTSLDLYLDGDFIVYNGVDINNELKLPSALQFWGTSSCSEIEIKNSGDFYGAIYAPDAYVELKNSGDIYGSVVADEVIIFSSAAFHYDEALARANPNDPGVRFIVSRWYEE